MSAESTRVGTPASLSDSSVKRVPVAEERVPVGRAAAHVVREDDRDTGLGCGADGDPAEAFVGDVVTQFEAEDVAVEGEGAVEVAHLDPDVGEPVGHGTGPGAAPGPI